MNTAPSGAVKEYSSQAEPPAPPTASRLPALVGQGGPPAHPSSRAFFFAPCGRGCVKNRTPPPAPNVVLLPGVGGGGAPPCQSFCPDIFSRPLREGLRKAPDHPVRALV